LGEVAHRGTWPPPAGRPKSSNPTSAWPVRRGE
jgi:hypothetical protein